MTPQLISLAKQYFEDLLSFYGVNAEVQAEGEDDTIRLSVDTDGGGRLIGHRGENLAALQHVLNMMIRRKTDDRIYVHVDVGGYRKARLEKLEEEAREAIDRVKGGESEVRLPMMNAAERRHIHSYIGEVEGVQSESQGEGNRRRLIVKSE